MKVLYLLRHAKSDWGNAALPDAARPLNARGLRAAPLIGEALRERKVLPNAIICSPAERAQQTAALVKAAAGLTAEVKYDERIYGADVARLLRVVEETDEAVGSLLLVGHNPGITEFCHYLTGETRRFPTAALACLNLNMAAWREAHESCGNLNWMITPKDLQKV